MEVRVFSFRSAQQRWKPKDQRPELWRLYHRRKHKGESVRVFPISNWTELDVWDDIQGENRLSRASQFWKLYANRKKGN